MIDTCKLACAESAQDDEPTPEELRRLWIVEPETDQASNIAYPARPRLHRSGEFGPARPVTWTVPGFCKAGALSMVYGEPGDGKTLALMDQGLAIATGTEWAGLPTTQKTVLYIDLDNGEEEIGRRDALLRAGRNIAPDADVPMYYAVEEDMDLLTPAGRAIFKARCEACNPGVVYIDAISDTWAGGDENGAQDILPILRFLVEQVTRYDCGIVAIHHPTKVGKTFRGTSTIKQKVRTLHRFTAKNDNQKTFHCEKNRFGKREDLTIGVAFNADDTQCIVTGTSGQDDKYQPILEYVKRNPGCTNNEMFAAGVGPWKLTTIQDYAGILTRQKRLVNDETKDGLAARYRLA
jgi:RecA-family ATPase